MPRSLRLVLALALTLVAHPATAERATIAVAANFTAAAKQIGKAFEASTGHRLRISFGSTGQLYAQILHGAPFDAFLAADQVRPALLHEKGKAAAPFTYAVGKLALWSADPEFIGGAAALEDPALTRLAIANPRTAPYGAAAVEVLKALGAWERVQKRLVEGRSVAQTREFVAAGAAPAGFVAWSQVRLSGEGSAWLAPAHLHAPLAQDAVLLTRGADNAAAKAFLIFLKGPEARAILDRYGYGADPQAPARAEAPRPGSAG